jgi:hypothetical protein
MQGRRIGSQEISRILGYGDSSAYFKFKTNLRKFMRATKTIVSRF